MAALTEREAAVYDRQIRLWGVEAQKRLQNSRVLICGFKGLGAEVAKNLSLAGFSISVLDAEQVQPVDLGANFFLSSDDVGKNRAEAALPRLKELNPLVQMEALSLTIAQVTEAVVQRFNCVLITSNVPMEEQIRINELCRKHGVNFFAGSTYGGVGVFFADLGASYTCTVKQTHQEHVREIEQSGSVETVEQALAEPKMLTKTLAFPDLKTSNSTPWKDLMNRRFGTPSLYFGVQILYRFQKVVGRPADSTKDEDWKTLCYLATDMAVEQGEADAGAFVSERVLDMLWRTIGAELSPVCAVLGGIVGQEIVKVIARKGEPLWESKGGNWIFLDTMGQTDQKGGAVVKSIP
jgi:ubiquitin-like 1-activating enzyme E1 A|eukprot:g1943.t1